MAEIRLQAVITEDHQLIVRLPATLLPGPVEITISPIDAPVSEPSAALTREEVRRRLAAADHLQAPQPLSKIEDEYDFTPVVLPPGSLTSDQIIDEDRGPR